MALETIRLSTTLPVPPSLIYAAWISGAGHSKMTGSKATSEPRVGGRFTAWNGDIEGEHLELDANKRIVQSWRSSQFPSASPDSRVEVTLNPIAGGTEIVLVHTDIPEGQGHQYESGWGQYYFEPMAKYFAAPAPAKTSGSKASAKGAEPTAKKVAKKAATKGAHKAAAKTAQNAAKKAAKKGAQKDAKRVAKKAAAKTGARRAGQGAKKRGAKSATRAAKKVSSMPAKKSGKNATSRAKKGAAKHAKKRR